MSKDKSKDNQPAFTEVEEGLDKPIDPADPQDQSTGVEDDDYKDMQLEIHRFSKRHARYQDKMYNWDNLK